MRLLLMNWIDIGIADVGCTWVKSELSNFIIY